MGDLKLNRLVWNLIFLLCIYDTMGKCFLFEQPYHHSNRGCVYITGVQAEQERKLLGVPETKDGT